MSDIWPIIHAERQSLADDLSTLSAEQWQTSTACSEWTVHDLLAHLLSAAKMTPPRFITRFAGAGFNFDKFAGKQVAIEGKDGPAATLTAFRAAQSRETAPPGPKDTWLGEAFVHGEDIRRPLGISHSYPLPYVTRVITLYANSNAIIGGKRRVAGVRLKANDIGYSVGSGPVVEGPAVALMLAASGRKEALKDLSGDGVQILQSR
jgi:uncharacterized protein (TIGR03083 family)